MRAIDCKEDQLSSIILAGGDGTRLNSLTRKIAGEQNERFYKPLAFNGIETNLAVQPTNRGTAPAVLFGLFRLIKLGQQGTVAIFPSDHYVSDDFKFMSHVEVAATAVSSHLGRIVLLGNSWDRPETHMVGSNQRQQRLRDHLRKAMCFPFRRF